MTHSIRKHVALGLGSRSLLSTVVLAAAILPACDDRPAPTTANPPAKTVDLQQVLDGSADPVKPTSNADSKDSTGASDAAGTSDTGNTGGPTPPPDEAAAPPLPPVAIGDSDGEHDTTAKAVQPKPTTASRTHSAVTVAPHRPAVAGEPSAPPPSAPNGAELFAKKCKGCHGATGDGKTKIGAEHHIDDWTVAGWKGKWPESKVVAIVTKGKPDTKMKAFANKLSEDEILAVAKYARSLGK